MTFLCSNVKICPTGNRCEIVLYLLHQKNKISAASLTVAAARIVPKIRQGQPQQCAHSAPNYIKIG